MRTVFTNLKSYASYRRTLRELRSLPLDVALDLDIAGAERAVARRAVYGAV
ncbi:glyceraldehyde-3-phosphate dehydrogenase [Roseivivax marinus]|uniref:glyceraldehyde-3-phosphate dehydrogenase n=1 Tax=Roseivivax marinus TaxID=1379903 RepID=UPI0004B15A17|nr:glyceraldehyde-3-phosphate dehydrogenase [Roseivivax marinus]UMA66087.1 glyceraldehyde-3-phosphate dehydrogenase [Roseivivax marinus]SEL05085.1 hypothetical protein SAMN05444413_105145 [Roseivivax marinus]